MSDVYIACPEGHYVCEACHGKESFEIIQKIVLETLDKDPLLIAESLMNYPGLPMLGCHHAYIACGSIMAALKNEGSRDIKAQDIFEVFKRTKKQAISGYCGLTGVCGIAPAIGACFSVLTGSRCGTDMEQRITMKSVTSVMDAIAELTGPSCCKAYVWVSLKIAIKHLKEFAGIALPSEREYTCIHSSSHPHGCRELKCPYYSVC